MREKWILDVLADMRGFARLNELPRLAEALDHAALVAAAELEDSDARRTAPVDAR